jgi:hypothetical protein
MFDPPHPGKVLREFLPALAQPGALNGPIDGFVFATP